MRIHRKLIVLSALSLIFVLGFIVVVFLALKSATIQPSKKSALTIVPTVETPVVTQPALLSVVSSKPENGDTNVAIDIAEIRILFSGKPVINAYSIRFEDQNTKARIGINVSVEGSQMIIQPLMTLAPETVYTVSVLNTIDKVQIFTMTFTTVSTPPLNTFPSGFDVYTEQRDLRERPDIYLANKLPYIESVFIMTLEVPDNGPYVFHVKAKITDVKKVRTNVVDWLHSIGLTDEDIAGFTIRYE